MKVYDHLITESTLEELDLNLKKLLKKPGFVNFTLLFNLCFYRYDYINALQVFINNGQFLKYVKLCKSITYNEHHESIIEHLLNYDVNCVITILENHHLFLESEIRDVMFYITNLDILLQLSPHVLHRIITENYVGNLEIYHGILSIDSFRLLNILNPYLNVSKIFDKIIMSDENVHDLLEYILDNYDIRDIDNMQYVEYEDIFIRLLQKCDDLELVLEKILISHIYETYEYKIIYLLNIGVKPTNFGINMFIFNNPPYFYLIERLLNSSENIQIDLEMFINVYYNRKSYLVHILNVLFKQYPDEYKYIFNIITYVPSFIIQISPYNFRKKGPLINEFSLPSKDIEDLPSCKSVACWKFNMINMIKN